MTLLYAVYIFKCYYGTYYTGYTTDIDKRLMSHNKGDVHYTKDKLPLELIHLSLFNNKMKAYGFERYLKSGSGSAFRNMRLI